MSDNTKVFTIVNSAKEFESALKCDKKLLVILHFSAPWAPQCQQVDTILTELCKNSALAATVRCIKMEAESVPEISLHYKVVAVPTCILVKAENEIDRVNGVNASELAKKIQQHSGVSIKTFRPSSNDTCETLPERLKKLVSSSPVMVFMKGTRDQPQCGFSKTLMQILKDNNAQFSSFDILTDETVRQGLKEFSNWPTYPQLYINGELVGGLDIVKELVASGEFQSMLPSTTNNSSHHLSIEDRLKQLISRQHIMLFMKGNPDTPRCGFSKTIVALLNEKNVKYGHFDILEDEEVRQGLKTFSNWPTYPQLYVNGELVGGLDIIKEMNSSGELDALLTTPTK